MLTTRVQIGTIAVFANSAQGQYWGLDHTAKGTFFGTIGDVRESFRRTQSRLANLQFDADGSVWVVVPSLFDLANFDANGSVSLTGNKVDRWTSPGGAYMVSDGNGPTYLKQDPAFKNQATLAFDGSKYLISDSVAKAMNGLRNFGVEIVATVGIGPGLIYDSEGPPELSIGFVAADVLNVFAANGRDAVSVAAPGDALPHTFLFTGDASNVYLYIDGILAGTAASTSAIASSNSKLGSSTVPSNYYNGKLASFKVGASLVSASEAKKSAQANTLKYVP